MKKVVDLKFAALPNKELRSLRRWTTFQEKISFLYTLQGHSFLGTSFTGCLRRIQSWKIIMMLIFYLNFPFRNYRFSVIFLIQFKYMRRLLKQISCCVKVACRVQIWKKSILSK